MVLRPEEKPEPCDGEFGRYIVVFSDWVEDPETLAHEQVEKYGGKLGFIYKYALKGYSAEYAKNVIDSVRNEPSVHYVEVDGIVEALGATSEGQADPASEDDCVIDFGSGSPTASAPTGQIDSGGAASASPSSATASGSTKRCAKGKVRKGSRCVRRRTLSRKACSPRKSSRRCLPSARD